MADIIKSDNNVLRKNLEQPDGTFAQVVAAIVTNALLHVDALCEGNVAHDSPILGNPIRIGGRAMSGNYTFVANGDVADIATTTAGAVMIKPYAPADSTWSTSLSLTSTTSTTIRTAATAGVKRSLTGIQAINTGASAVDLIVLDGTTERWRITLPPNVPFSCLFLTELTVTAATQLNANLSASGTVRANFQGYNSP